MSRLFCIFFFFVCFQNLYSQIQKPIMRDQNEREIDTTKASTTSTSNKGLKNENAKIEMYKIISNSKDTTYVDTTLSIQKEYKFNYLRKDNFELIAFSNIGQTYNTLSYDFENSNTIPLFAARARHFNYLEIEDVNY